MAATHADDLTFPPTMSSFYLSTSTFKAPVTENQAAWLVLGAAKAKVRSRGRIAVHLRDY